MKHAQLKREPMKHAGWKRSALIAGLMFAVPAAAQQSRSASQPERPAAQPAQKKKDGPAPLLGAGSKEPIKIDADRLDVFDRDGRAVFTGNVVAVQGDSTIRCTIMTVFYEQNRAQAQAAGQPRQPSAASGSNDNSIKKIDCQGPVTVVSKTQTATGDNAIYDKANNKVIITGNVALADGPNVMRGERIVYDLDSGIANVDPKTGERVKALIVPGSGNQDGKPKVAAPSAPEPAAKPKAAAPAAETAPKPRAQRPASAQATN
jgi:lipopolysaccharide export system protein LptA